MEVRGLIVPLTKFQQPHTHAMVTQSSDGLLDLYFDYYIGPVDQERIAPSTLSLARLSNPRLWLHEFALNYRSTHPDAVFAKGLSQAHYCAWPMPIVKLDNHAIPSFCTAEGYLFQWNVLPFDFPLSERLWEK